MVGKVAARGVMAGARQKPAQFLGGNGDVFGHFNPLEGVVEVLPSPLYRVPLDKNLILLEWAMAAF